MTRRIPLAMATAATLAVLVVVAGAVFFLEAPAVAREKRLDEAQARTLGCMERQITAAYRAKNALPDTLDGTCLAQGGGAARIAYERTGAATYRLCATWRHAGPARSFSLWPHPAGYACSDHSAAQRD